MIKASEALRLIEENSRPLESKGMNLESALNLVLAEDIYCPIDLPPFDQSAMDGYAFRYADWKEGTNLIVKNIIPAGFESKTTLAKGDAVKIFTGAQVPNGADTVVPIEKAIEENNLLAITDALLEYGINIRKKGSHIEKSNVALKRGDILKPAAIGFLSAMGIRKVQAIPKPSVLIVITGNELLKPGEPLKEGHIYESNGVMVASALSEDFVFNYEIHYCKDDPEELFIFFKNIKFKFDLVIITGGISVGDYDYTKQVLHRVGVKEVFHKVKQKPGKPLYFGMWENKPVFALPGNPAAVLTCYYVYVRSCLKKLIGDFGKSPKSISPLFSAYKKKTGLTHFVKGKMENGMVKILEGQESYILKSFAEANCLVILPEEAELFVQGEPVEIINL